jgi:anti-anti-sigma regulatory factor
MEQQQRIDPVVLRPRGPFGLLEAFQLERQLYAEPDRRVLIDFSEVEDATDVSLIVLSDVVRLAGARLQLAGVTNPHRRLLEEFGISVPELPSDPSAQH